MKFFILLIAAIIPLLGCKEDYIYKKREARGVWISRYEYTRGELKDNPELQKEYIRRVFKKARDAKFNMIIFQVRGNGDAFYNSSYEPWGEELTGTLGKDPGYDPLGFAVETAHELGLELHAWLNTFPAWKKSELPIETTPRHPLLDYPDWLVCDKDGNPMKPGEAYISFSPGNPEVHKHIQSVVREIVSKYDVDGIHFDYIRYPEGTVDKGFSHDKVSVERFNSTEGNPHRLDWNEWQREQVNHFIAVTYNEIKKIKPFVQVSAAVIGNYRSNKWNGYYAVHQDAGQWLSNNKVDFIVPMAYMNIEHPTHPFTSQVWDWNYIRKTLDKNIFLGLGAYRLRSAGLEWDEMETQMKLLRETGFNGIVFFSMASIENKLNELGKKEFKYYANIPVSGRDSTVQEDIFEEVKLIAENDSVRLEWKLNENYRQSNFYFNIYRSTDKNFSITDPQNIFQVTPRGKYSFTDTGIENGENYYYAVSALDRFNRESKIYFLSEAK